MSIGGNKKNVQGFITKYVLTKLNSCILNVNFYTEYNT